MQEIDYNTYQKQSYMLRQQDASQTMGNTFKELSFESVQTFKE